MIDQQATRDSFERFILDKDRSQSYLRLRYADVDKKAFPWLWVIIGGFLIITVIAVPAGLIVLYIGFRKRKSPRDSLLEHIRQQDVIETFIVCSNSDVQDPSKAGAGLLIGSFDESTPELEKACRRVAKQLQHLFVTQTAEDPNEQELLEFLFDEKNVVKPRRRIPEKYTGDHAIYAFNAPVDQACIDEGFDPFSVSAIGYSAFGDLDAIPVECVVQSASND